jgi:hypothetical protein
MKIDNIYKTLEGVGQDIVDQMGAIIKQHNSIASGKLLNSLAYDVYVENGVWNLVIEYADYGKYVDKGRNPGRFPPKGAIEEWCRLKGLPKSAVWPIMVKIKKGGFYSKKMGTVRMDGKSSSVYTPPKGINFTDPFTKSFDITKLKEEFAEAFSASIKEDIINELKKTK